MYHIHTIDSIDSETAARITMTFSGNFQISLASDVMSEVLVANLSTLFFATVEKRNIKS